MGCAESNKLGKSVSLLKTEQAYNANATEENKDLVPDGSAEKANTAIEGYNKGDSKNITVSQGL